MADLLIFILGVAVFCVLLNIGGWNMKVLASFSEFVENSDDEGDR